MRSSQGKKYLKFLTATLLTALFGCRVTAELLETANPMSLLEKIPLPPFY